MAGLSNQAGTPKAMLTFDQALKRVEGAGVRPDSDDWQRFHRTFSDKTKLTAADVDMFLHQ